MADTYDLLSLAEAKRAINVPDATTTYDTELAGVITGVSQRIVDICGPVVNRTFTNETYDGDGEWIELRNTAIGDQATTTLTTVNEYDTAGTATLLSAEDYDTKPANAYRVDQATGLVYRRSAGYAMQFTAGHGNVVFTYTSGRAANTAAVPAKFKVAAQIMTAHVWRQRGAQAGAYRSPDTDGGPMFGVAPFATPHAVTDLLRREIRPDRVIGVA